MRLTRKVRNTGKVVSAKKSDLGGMSLHHHLLRETASKKLACEIEIAPRYFARLDEAVFQAGKTEQAGQHAHYIDLFAYLLRLQWWGILSEQVQSAE